MTLEIYTMPGHLIRRLHQASTQLFQQVLKQAGHELTPVQFAALDALGAAPGIDQAQLATLIAYDRATIGGVVERLEKRGLLRREINRTDRRARVLSLTAEGAALLDAALPVVRALQDEILGGLDPEERGTLCRLMAKSLQVTAEAQDTPPPGAPDARKAAAAPPRTGAWQG